MTNGHDHAAEHAMFRVTKNPLGARGASDRRRWYPCTDANCSHFISPFDSAKSANHHIGAKHKNRLPIFPTRGKSKFFNHRVTARPCPRKSGARVVMETPSSLRKRKSRLAMEDSAGLGGAAGATIFSQIKQISDMQQRTRMEMEELRTATHQKTKRFCGSNIAAGDKDSLIQAATKYQLEMLEQQELLEQRKHELEMVRLNRERMRAQAQLKLQEAQYNAATSARRSDPVYAFAYAATRDRKPCADFGESDSEDWLPAQKRSNLDAAKVYSGGHSGRGAIWN